MIVFLDRLPSRSSHDFAILVRAYKVSSENLLNSFAALLGDFSSVFGDFIGSASLQLRVVGTCLSSIIFICFGFLSYKVSSENILNNWSEWLTCAARNYVSTINVLVFYSSFFCLGYRRGCPTVLNLAWGFNSHKK